MQLSDLISAASYKQLARVDLPEHGSNQHEINGVQALREFFGTSERTRVSVSWHYFAENEGPIQDHGDLTFYDARKAHATRTEWRLYYTGDFLRVAEEGDVLVLLRLRTRPDRLHALVIQADSSWLRAAEQLFGVTSLNPANFEVVSQDGLQARELGFVASRIIEELGIEQVTIPAAQDDLELVSRTFDKTFPRTRDMSLFARQQVGDVTNVSADDALVRWLDREEQLFRALERLIVEEQVKKGFGGVDEFVEFSLSVQNRRKSRMGYSLQNNLSALFDLHKLRYEAQALTEGKNRPDFVFPGAKEYHDDSFSAGLLVMLGAKSSLKERWRQILTEAQRIPQKHLCTLEPGISVDQTDEMNRHSVLLVIPSALHPTFTTEQRRQLWTVSGFVEFVRAKETTS